MSSSVAPSKLPLLLFDVDGTLTVPRLKMTTELGDYLKELRAKGVPLAVVGGSDLKKVTEQLGDSLEDIQSRFDYVFTENGLVGFKGTTPLPVASIQSRLGERELQRLINWVLAYFSRLELPCKRGNFVEFRSGMLNFSPIGRSCTYEERIEFDTYDNEHGIRVKFAEEMRREFADLDLEVAIGGQISVDVFPKGWDKTYCLRYLEKEHETIHFFGDRTMEGGNDHAIFVDPRTIGRTVTSPDDTRDQMAVVIPAANRSRDEWEEIPDEELEETLLERLEGLTEAIPESLRSAVCTTASWSKSALFGTVAFTRSAVWVVATTSLIMFLPYIIEKERSDIEKTQMAQQRQMLLGPAASQKQKK